MKLKYLCLGLLSTLIMVNQAGAMRQSMQDAPKTQQKLEHVEAKLDVARHGGVEQAAQDVVDNIGKHPVQAARSGKTVNHRITDVNARLGTKAAAPTGPSAHHKITDLMAIQGAVTNQATAQGANSGNVGNAPNDLAGTAIKNEEKILERLKAGIRANAGVAVIGLVNTKTTNTVAGPLAVGDFVAADAATNIEDFLAELGW